LWFGDPSLMSAEPQWPQNLAAGSFAAPQAAHVSGSEPPGILATLPSQHLPTQLSPTRSVFASFRSAVAKPSLNQP
jgi:hypothetical protein